MIVSRLAFVALMIAVFSSKPAGLYGQAATTPKPITEIAVPVLQRDAQGIVSILQAPDAIVCYSLDGSDPSAQSGRYLAPVDLSHGGILKARAFSQNRKASSAVAVASYDPLPGLKPLPSTLVPVTQDRSWPGYDWERRHVEVCKRVKEKDPQILFIGDSITHFFHDQIWKQNYEPYRAVNLGYGWDRTENVLWRLGHGELEGASPKVVVVMIGTNNLEKNTNAEITAGVKAIGESISTHLPKAKILLLGIFPRGEKPSDLRDRVTSINQELAKLDGQAGVTYLNFGKAFLEADGTLSKEIMPDSLHPSEKGYQIWVKAMQPTLDRLLKE